MIGCLFLYGFGFILGYFFGKFLGYNQKQCYFLGAVYSSPHTTSIPVILFSIIGPVLDKVIPMPLELPVNSQKRGYLYIILNSIFSNIWKWSAGYYFIQKEDYDISEKKLSKYPYKPPASMSIKKFLKEIITAPLVVSFISIFMTIFPSIQNTLNKEDSYIYNSFMIANSMIGKSYSFFVMLTLGLSLCESMFPEREEERNKKVFFRNLDIIWLSLGKLLLMPLITWPFLIYLCRRILHADDVMLFLFLFLGMAPGAINLIVITQIKEAFQESISMLMMAMYGIALITITFGVTIIITLIGYLNNAST